MWTQQPCYLVSLPDYPCSEATSFSCSCFSYEQSSPPSPISAIGQCNSPPVAPHPIETPAFNLDFNDQCEPLSGETKSSLYIPEEMKTIEPPTSSTDTPEKLLPPVSPMNEPKCLVVDSKPRRGRPPNPIKATVDIEGQYDCILCAYSCQSLNLFLIHIDAHAGPNRPFVCQLCSKAFKSLPIWRNHICSHLALRPFECDLCKGRYLTNTDLIRHKRYKHGGSKPYRCPVCQYECIELAKLIRHQRMHAGHKPFKCPSCQYESYDKSKIRRHYVTHTREKPFQCALCGSRFTQSGSLKTHLTNVHQMDRVEFRCPFCCKLVTPNMGELRNHIKTLHYSTYYPMIVNKVNSVTSPI